MNRKLIVPALIVVVLVIVAGFLAARKGAEHPDEQGSANTPATSAVVPQTSLVNPTPATLAEPSTAPTPLPTGEKPVQGHFSSSEEAEGVDTQVFEVGYDGTNFSPKTLSVKVGDIVIFKNNSKSSFEPASDPHPQHTNYPEFDADKAIAAGQTYEFKFSKVGTWGYHDHRNAAARGSIIVTK